MDFAHADEAEIATLISQIGDVLPEYGTGYLVACLEHFEWSAERVINSLLEGSLPPQLQGLDKQAARLPHSMQQPSSAAHQWPAAQSSRGKAIPRGKSSKALLQIPTQFRLSVAHVCPLSALPGSTDISMKNGSALQWHLSAGLGLSF